jgi:hypothetical protein
VALGVVCSQLLHTTNLLSGTGELALEVQNVFVVFLSFSLVVYRQLLLCCFV